MLRYCVFHATCGAVANGNVYFVLVFLKREIVDLKPKRHPESRRSENASRITRLHINHVILHNTTDCILIPIVSVELSFVDFSNKHLEHARLRPRAGTVQRCCTSFGFMPIAFCNDSFKSAIVPRLSHSREIFKYLRNGSSGMALSNRCPLTQR